MPAKREVSSEDESGSASDQVPRTPTPKKSKANADSSEKPKSSPNKSGRVSSDAKRGIAEEIIKIGIAGIDREKTAKNTGLTVQQVRSQLVDNRSNLRRQLMDLAKAL